MGRVFIVDLEGQIYSCKHCNTHLTKEQDIMSKSFQCRYGQAYLFNEVVNISTGNEEDRMLMTGLHTVTDIFCVGCGSNVGWKYVTAHDINQKYKEGKSVLELNVDWHRIRTSCPPEMITFPCKCTIFHQLVHLELSTDKADWWNLHTRMINTSPRLKVLKLVGEWYYGKVGVSCKELNQSKNVPTKTNKKKRKKLPKKKKKERSCQIHPKKRKSIEKSMYLHKRV
ncbi:unnamed protein product [Brassica rapa subsp. trilocularis]